MTKNFPLRDRQQEQITFFVLNNSGFLLLSIYPPRFTPSLFNNGNQLMGTIAG